MRGLIPFLLSLAMVVSLGAQVAPSPNNTVDAVPTTTGTDSEVAATDSSSRPHSRAQRVKESYAPYQQIILWVSVFLGVMLAASIPARVIARRYFEQRRRSDLLRSEIKH